MPLVQVTDLSFEYPGKRALDRVTFALHDNSITALVGANGSGKTTLLRCMAALETPYYGTVQIDGLDTQLSPRECHTKLGYLSDSFGLYDDLPVRNCLQHMAAIHGFTGREESRVVQDIAAKVGLRDLLSVRAGALSRGQRQRVGIAQAILHKPQVLLLDEPASGLDPEARAELSRLLLELKAQGMTLVVSSHILAELEDYSDYMLTLANGTVRGHVSIGAESRSRKRSFSVKVANEHIVTAQALLTAHPLVSGVVIEDEQLSFHFSGVHDEQALLLERLITERVRVFAFTEERRTMQDVYLAQMADARLTQKSSTGGPHES